MVCCEQRVATYQSLKNLCVCVCVCVCDIPPEALTGEEVRPAGLTGDGGRLTGLLGEGRALESEGIESIDREGLAGRGMDTVLCSKSGLIECFSSTGVAGVAGEANMSERGW